MNSKQYENEEKQDDPSKGWQLPFINEIKSFVKEKPKKAYFIMVGITFISLLFTIGHIVYTKTVVVPEYNAMKNSNIFKGATNSLLEPVVATQKALDIKEVLTELEYYRSKRVLTATDSLRVKYLIDKYRTNDKK